MVPEDMILEFGTDLLDKKHPALAGLIETRLRQCRKVLCDLKECSDVMSSMAFIKFGERAEGLERLLEWVAANKR
jgi:hypothetical protein